MKLNLIGLAFGAAFGALLAGARLHEYDTIHAMLRLDEPDVYLLMTSSVATSVPLLWLLERRGITTPLGGALRLSRSRPEAHHWRGGALFGVGWALAGACPAPALIMFGSGAMMGLVVMAGIFLGLWLPGRLALNRYEITSAPTSPTPTSASVDVRCGPPRHWGSAEARPTAAANS